MNRSGFVYPQVQIFIGCGSKCFANQWHEKTTVQKGTYLFKNRQIRPSDLQVLETVSII
jgi:hypothetical protein